MSTLNNGTKAIYSLWAQHYPDEFKARGIKMRSLPTEIKTKMIQAVNYRTKEEKHRSIENKMHVSRSVRKPVSKALSKPSKSTGAFSPEALQWDAIKKTDIGKSFESLLTDLRIKTHTTGARVAQSKLKQSILK